jgi:hypothetical protein
MLIQQDMRVCKKKRKKDCARNVNGPAEGQSSRNIYQSSRITYFCSYSKLIDGTLILSLTNIHFRKSSHFSNKQYVRRLEVKEN